MAKDQDNFLVAVALATALLSALAFALPLYEFSASPGGVALLTAFGWAGNPLAPAALGIVPAQDYSFLGWALALATAGAGLVCALACVRHASGVAPWAALAACAWVPVLAAVVPLAADLLPMPYFAVAVAGGSTPVAATAAWSWVLWGLALAASVATGGCAAAACNAPPAPAPAPDAGRAGNWNDQTLAALERELQARDAAP